jgi:hypothetical protein
MDRLPLGLRQVLESGDCVLFVGAGVGHHFKRPDGTSAPDGPTLAKAICAQFGISVTSSDIPDLAKNRTTRGD